jgi:hypothetical protein
MPDRFKKLEKHGKLIDEMHGEICALEPFWEKETI